MSPLSITPVVGLPQFIGWSQVIENGHRVSGRLVLAFAIAGEHAGNVGRDVSELVATQTLMTAQELFEFLETLIADVESKDCQIHFACGLFAGHTSVFAAHGGSIFLKRDDKSGQIVHSDRKLVLVEGRHEDGDIFVLSTRQASEFLNEVTLKFSQGYDVDTIITSIVPGLHGQDDSSLSAMAFVTDGDEVSDEEREDLALGETAVIADSAFKPQAKSVRASVPNVSPIASATIDASDDDESKIVQSESDVVHNEDSVVAQLLQTDGVATTSEAIEVQRAPNKIVNLVKKIGAGLRATIKSTVAIPKRWSTPNVYVGQNISRQKKIAVFVLIVVAIVGGVIWRWRAGIAAQQETGRQLVAPISAEIYAAQAEYEQNPVESRERVSQSIGQLEALAVEYEAQSVIVELIEEEKAQAQAWYDANSGQNEVSELPVFYDLRLAQSDFIASEVAGGEGRAVFVDAEKQQLIVLNLENKQVMVFSPQDIGRIRSVRFRDDGIVLLADGIYSLALAEDAQPTQIIEEGDSNREAEFLGAYEIYLYVFNAGRRNIYRYAESDDGYSDPIGWLTSSQGLVFEDVVSMAIDGDIWLTTRTGELKRFTRGEAVDFEIQGLPQPFEQTISVFTTVDSENIYVLDATAGRVVVLSKEGEFLREIASSSLSSATHLFVSESMGKAFAVSGSTVYEVGL